MALKGMAEFTVNGEDYTINDPNVANEFSTATAYAVGNHVTYQGKLYVFTAAHSAGAWNAAHVVEKTIGEELNEKDAAITEEAATREAAITEEAATREAAITDLKSALKCAKIDPLVNIWDKLLLNETEQTDHPGLMTTDLTVWGSNYPQYFGYFDVAVTPGEIYAIEGTATSTGYKPFILCDGNTVKYYIKENPTEPNALYRNIIEIPEGVNRIIINFSKQVGDASSNGVIATFDGFDYLEPFCNLDAINPDAYNWEDYIIDDEESHAGLVTDALIIHQTQYPQYYKYFDIAVTEGDIYAVEGQAYKVGYLPVMLAKDNTLLYYPETYYHPAENTLYRNIIVIPHGVNRLIVNGDVVAGIGRVGHIIGRRGNWGSKKIVWFGTSIPAGNATPGGGQTISSYPLQIGYALGATVYNEAVGSSCVRAGSFQHISEEDPMGWSGMDARGLCLSLSLSSSEKQTMFDAWESKWKNVIPNSQYINLTEAQITAYKNTSWDIKLAKYLTGGSVGTCDLYVFDHGVNDGLVDSSIGYSDLNTVPANETDRTYWIGAMQFLFRKILDDNPRACIVIIGHYMNNGDPFGRGTKYDYHFVTNAQEKIANKWGFPIVKTWEKLGISMNMIDVDGTSVTILQNWFPDKLHPSSDTTGKALKHYANVLTPLIKEIGW